MSSFVVGAPDRACHTTQQVSQRCCCGPSLFSGFFPVGSRPVLMALPARVTTLSQQHLWVPPSFAGLPPPLPVPSPRAPACSLGPVSGHPHHTFEAFPVLDLSECPSSGLQSWPHTTLLGRAAASPLTSIPGTPSSS